MVILVVEWYNNNRIEVYDNNNVLRVRMGLW